MAYNPLERFRLNHPEGDVRYALSKVTDECSRDLKDFIAGETSNTYRISRLISDNPGTANEVSCTSALIEIPQDPETSDGDTLFGVRLVQEFMPGDPFHIRKNHIDSFAYSKTGKFENRMVGILESFDFLVGGPLLQAETIALTLEALEAGEWFATQAKFEAEIGKIDLLQSISAVL